VKSLKPLITISKTMLVLTCTAPGCDQGQGYPFKTPNTPDADARMLLNMHLAWHARRHPPDPELAKEQALRVNTKKATKMKMEPELECTALCTRCEHETPQLVSELPMWLLELHWASPHTCTPPADSVQLPSVPSITARDTHGLLTKSLHEGIRIKSSAEAAIKPETRYSSPAAGHEFPAEHEPPKSATKVDKPSTSDVARQANMANMVPPELGGTFPSCTTLTDSVKLPAVPSTTAEDPYGLLFTKSLSEEIGIKSSEEAPIKTATSDVARRATKAAKKARQRAAKYRPEKLLLAQTMPEEQVTSKKDPTDSMQQLTKSLQDGTQIKTSIVEAAPQSSIAEASLQSSPAEAAIKTSMAEASPQSSTAEAAPKTSEEAAIKISEETTLKTSEEAAIKASEEEAFKISEERALKTSEEAALKTSEEATTKTETMCSSEKLAVNESLCISSKVCKAFDDDPSQTEVTMANTDVTSSQPEIPMANTDVTPSQTEITKDNTDENPSQPEIAKLDESVTSNRTNQASKYKLEKVWQYDLPPPPPEPAPDIWPGSTSSHTCTTSEASSMMASTEKDSKPVPSITKHEKHSQELICWLPPPTMTRWSTRPPAAR
jgi:hypothetical protein